MKNPMLLKPKMKVYVVLLVAAVGCMVWLNRCSREMSVVPFVKSGGDTLDVAIEYSPLSLYMYDDTLGGFNHDLLQLISRKKGVCIKEHPVVSLHESLKALDEGFFDLIAAQVPATVDFKSKYLFSDSIYLDRQVLVQLKDSLGNAAVKSQLDIGGKTLHIVKNSPVESRIENFAREIGDTIYIVPEEYGQEQLFLMVAAGEMEYAVVSSKIAQAMGEKYPEVDISTDVSFNQFQSWVLRKDNIALCDSLNSWLRDVRQTEAYRTLCRRYFGK